MQTKHFSANKADRRQQETHILKEIEDRSFQLGLDASKIQKQQEEREARVQSQITDQLNKLEESIVSSKREAQETKTNLIQMLLEESKEIENLIEEESHAHEEAAQQLSNLIQSLHYDLLHEISSEKQMR